MASISLFLRKETHKKVPLKSAFTNNEQLNCWPGLLYVNLVTYILDHKSIFFWQVQPSLAKPMSRPACNMIKLPSGSHEHHVTAAVCRETQVLERTNERTNELRINLLKVSMRGIHLKGMRGQSIVR
jgi:hypothetical protein